MISFQSLKSSSHWNYDLSNAIEKIAGVKFVTHCAECKSDDEILVLDETKKTGKNETVYIPIKYFNFLFALVKIKKGRKRDEKGTIYTHFGIGEVNSALRFANEKFFTGNKPIHIPDGINFTSYRKLVDFVSSVAHDEDWRFKF